MEEKEKEEEGDAADAETECWDLWGVTESKRKLKIVLSSEIWITPNSVLEQACSSESRKVVCTIWAQHITQQSTGDGIVP